MTEILQKNQSAIEKRMKEAGMNTQAIRREMSFALQAISANNYLQKCTGDSLMAAVVNIANIGLTLNPAAKEAYLVPRKGLAILQPSYIGLCKLITQTGKVTDIQANVVYEGDQFDLDLADSYRPVTHRPCLRKKDRGDFVGVYAIATLKEGSKHAEWMDVDGINAIRGMSESWKIEKLRRYSPWVNHYDEMARKTVVKRLYKYLPRGENQDRIDDAIQLDNQEYLATSKQKGYIESLLDNSTFDHEHRAYIESQLNAMTYQQASQVIEQLKENQQDPIKHVGGRGRVKDINRAANDAVANPKT